MQRCPTIIGAIGELSIIMIHGCMNRGWLFSWTYFSGVFGRDEGAMQVGLASVCLMTSLFTQGQALLFGMWGV